MSRIETFGADLRLVSAAYGTPCQPERDLMALIAGQPPEQPWRRSRKESEALVAGLLDCWHILPAIPTTTLRGPLEQMLQPADYCRLQHARLAVTAFQRAQIVGSRELLRALEQHGVAYSLLKGAAAAVVLYPEPHMRAAWDFDIGVLRQDVGRAEALAIASGFYPAEKDPETKRFYHADPELRASVEAKHYELGFLARRLRVTNLPRETLEALRSEDWARQFWLDVTNGLPWCYAVVDIHHALSLDVGLGDLLARARLVVRADGQSVKVPDDSWLAAHLIFKTYWEGVHSYGKGLYQYADLVRLVQRLDEAVFGQLVNILERHNLLVAGYYVLRRLPLFGVVLPNYVLHFINDTARPPAGSDPLQLNDLGDMWPKLWGRR